MVMDTFLVSDLHLGMSLYLGQVWGSALVKGNLFNRVWQNVKNLKTGEIINYLSPSSISMKFTDIKIK